MLLESGECLEVTSHVDRRCRLVGKAAVVGLENGPHVLDNVGILPVIVDRESDGHHHLALPGQLDHGDLINAAVCRLPRLLHKADDGRNERNPRHRQEQNLRRRQVLAGGAELFANVERDLRFGWSGRPARTGLAELAGVAAAACLQASWPRLRPFYALSDRRQQNCSRKRALAQARCSHQACRIALANLSGGKVFRTSALVSQARRACSTP